jgi:hypothetical protein
MNTYTCEEFENIDINAWRNGYKWTINECLRLEREYDLLKLSVPEMAILHKRTMNAIMCKLQAEGLDTFNNLYIKTYGEDYIDEQINKLNNLCSTNDTDEEEEDDKDEFDEEDYVPHLDLDNDDGSNHTYVFHQVQRIHKHISNLLSYFTNSNATVKKEPELNCY